MIRAAVPEDADRLVEMGRAFFQEAGHESPETPFDPKTGRAATFFVAFLQALGLGVVKRTSYTFDQIALMTPTLNDTVICSDSSVTTIGDVLAGGGASIVQAIGDDTDWRVI